MAEQRTGASRRLRIFQWAVWRKSSRFTVSGLVVMAIGVILIAFGLFMDTNFYSAEGLLVGLGSIVVLIGIIRLLIGFINPAIPEDLPPIVEEEPEGESSILAQSEPE